MWGQEYFLTIINIKEVGPLFKHQILNSASRYKPKLKADGDISACSLLFHSVGQSAVYFGQCPFLPQRNNDENYRYWHRKLTHKLWRFLLDILMSPCHCILDFQFWRNKVSGLITNFNISLGCWLLGWKEY